MADSTVQAHSKSSRPEGKCEDILAQNEHQRSNSTADHWWANTAGHSFPGRRRFHVVWLASRPINVQTRVQGPWPLDRSFRASSYLLQHPSQRHNRTYSWTAACKKSGIHLAGHIASLHYYNKASSRISLIYPPSPSHPSTRPPPTLRKAGSSRYSSTLAPFTRY